MYFNSNFKLKKKQVLISDFLFFEKTVRHDGHFFRKILLESPVFKGSDKIRLTQFD